MVKTNWNPNFEKEFMKEIQEPVQKMGLDFLKQFKCPICGKQANIKSIENEEIKFHDFCHEEFKNLLEEKLK